MRDTHCKSKVYAKFAALSMAFLMCTALVVPHICSASVEITEIMHSPTQTKSDTDGEWIEVHNKGNYSVNLSEWKIDGHKFDPLVLEPGEYAVIARELIDGDDEDSESFESYWGNNDGVWDYNDGCYKAVDGYFALSGSDVVVLTDSNGSVVDNVSYNLATGDSGSTIEKANNSWVIGIVDGTPGYGWNEYPPLADNEALLRLNVENALPEIRSITIKGHNESNITVYPEFSKNRAVEVEAVVEDFNGVMDIMSVAGKAGNKTFNLSKSYAISNTSAVYSGTFELSPSDPAGKYTLTVTAGDGTGSFRSSLQFEYARMISTVVKTKQLVLSGMPSNKSQVQELKIANEGNSEVEVKLTAGNLRGKAGSISSSFIKMDDGGWKNLGTFSQSVTPGSTKNIKIRVDVPEASMKGEYSGKIKVIVSAK